MGSALRIWLKYVYIGFAHNYLDICLAIGLHLMEMNQNQLHSFKARLADNPPLPHTQFLIGVSEVSQTNLPHQFLGNIDALFSGPQFWDCLKKGVTNETNIWSC